jgi:hypothetical protein
MDVSLFPPSNACPSTGHSIEISVKGKWRKVPALEACGQTIAICGKWIKIAAVHDEEWLETQVSNPEACIQRIKELSDIGRADIFSFTQQLPSIVPRYQYPMELESIAVARVGSFKAWWEGLPQESRKNVRRCQKRGVMISRQDYGDELIRGIAEVQNECPVRQGRQYPHYGKTFDEVKRDHSSFIDRSDFLCAHLDGKLIGFLKVVYRGKIASILQLNSMAAHFDKRPANALLARAAELCSARGVEYLTYGRFNFGNKGNHSLREFKTRNGFEELMIPRFYVPLTSWGRLCVHAKLYRKPHEFLPHGVIETIVVARAKWYDLTKHA